MTVLSIPFDSRNPWTLNSAALRPWLCLRRLGNGAGTGRLLHASSLTPKGAPGVCTRAHLQNPSSSAAPTLMCRIDASDEAAAVRLDAQRDGESAVSSSVGRSLVAAARRPPCLPTLVGHLRLVIPKQLVHLGVFNSHRLFLPPIRDNPSDTGRPCSDGTGRLDRTDKQRCSILNICTDRADGSKSQGPIRKRRSVSPRRFHADPSRAGGADSVRRLPPAGVRQSSPRPWWWVSLG